MKIGVIIKTHSKLSHRSSKSPLQAFSAWIHVCAVRLFVESILRYGLPPRFLAALMKPTQKTVPKLRKTMASTFGEGASRNIIRSFSHGLIPRRML